MNLYVPKRIIIKLQANKKNMVKQLEAKLIDLWSLEEIK